MKSMRSLHTCTVILALMLMAGCAATTAIRQHPEFFDASRKIDSVVLLAPEVEVFHLVLSGDNERLPEREQQVQLELSNRIIAILQERGYRVQSLDKLMQAKQNPEAVSQIIASWLNDPMGRAATDERGPRTADQPVVRAA